MKKAAVVSCSLVQDLDLRRGVFNQHLIPFISPLNHFSVSTIWTINIYCYCRGGRYGGPPSVRLWGGSFVEPLPWRMGKKEDCQMTVMAKTLSCHRAPSFFKSNGSDHRKTDTFAGRENCVPKMECQSQPYSTAVN
jgi:hypothetical protein